MEKRIRSKDMGWQPAVIQREEHIPLISLEHYEVVRREHSSSYANRLARGMRIPAMAEKKEGEMSNGRPET